MPRSKKKLQPRPGWAIYLRTSDQEAQNPQNSQRRQRHAIERALISTKNLPVYNEYVDNLSGRYAANRPGYQQMLDDARAGHFSYVAVENAERFGRNDTEALVAIDELHELGIAVRFADYPDLDPIDPDDRILVGLSFTLARRESSKLGQRVRGGLHAKLRSGGYSGLAPDGYLNCEEKTDSTINKQNGRYTRWVEQDPDRIHIWREAWELLLEDRHTLEDICEELHKRGYHYRSGRPFVEIKPDGARRANMNSLHRIFHNWFYAGWVVSPKAEIPPKTVPGTWQPLVSTEEFERGLAILAKRSGHRLKKRKHDYLLRGLIYVEKPGAKKTRIVRLTGSTSNPSRPGGGTPYYCIPKSDINIGCNRVDEQIPKLLANIQIDPDLVPVLRDAYTEDVALKMGHLGPSEREKLQQALQDIEAEEERTARLYAAGKITERVWDNLWAGWQDRRWKLHTSLQSAHQQKKVHIRNLDDALTIFAKVNILFTELGRDDQKDLLRQIVK
ncbi:MAG: recombinase family protein, partial [Anaerolineae bacterium]|nr:recombinase family protein [Anaerolineae bacterium]